MQQRQHLLVVQVFVSRGHLATCALACAYACDLPFQWAALLAIVQAGLAGLEGLQTLDQDQQQLADNLHQVCPALHCNALPLPSCFVFDLVLPDHLVLLYLHAFWVSKRCLCMFLCTQAVLGKHLLACDTYVSACWLE